MSNETLLFSVDLLLRGGVGILLAFVAALLLRDYGHVAAARLCALFAAGGAANAVCTWAAARGHFSAWALPFLVLSGGNNVVFWLFARALFDDTFRLRRWHAALWFVITGICLVCRFWLEPARAAGADIVSHGLYLEAILF